MTTKLQEELLDIWDANQDSPLPYTGRDGKPGGDHSSYPTWMKEITLEMYRQGLNSYQIAALTGVGQVTISRWCRDANVTRSRSENAQA